ncbi:uncharacterized protein LOC121294936 isoform X2 [Polyodon spathula]|nr:uncharacterized protein LOC121294936 isoform X2 [Polyodon spathula]
MIKWTPTANDVGEDIPICFIAETTAEYQSELRCIIVVVEESQNESSIVIANEAPALGGFLSFTPKGKNSDGTIRMDSRFKLSEIYTGSCSPASSWKCHQGDCGTITTSEYGETDPGQSGDNCQLQGFVTRSLQNDKPFDLMDQGCCWIYNTEDLGSWSMIAHIDLGRRSDTGNPNRSPITTMPPQIRVPQNSPTTYNLLDYDPDGDNVRCRYGIKNNLECSTCKTVPGFTLDENACSLSFSGSSSPGVHVFELVLEDFPRQNTTLKYNDGTSTVKYPVSLNASDPLSKIPLQFLVIVGSAVPSNVLGEYIPKYITPTVHHGTFIRTSLGKKFSFPVSAVSTKSQIKDIEISGPLNIEKTFEYNNVTGVGKAMIKWTPTANDVGEDIPICFIAETTAEYQSELRCIIVVVEESQNESSIVIANEAPALGGFLSFTPKGKNSDGTIRMDSRFKLSEIYTGSCSPASSWKCHQGDCGTITTSEYGETDPGQSGDNCQLQGFVTRSLQNDKPFDLMDQGCCWIYNTEDLGSWSMIAHIDLGRRSDTGNPNRSPITTMPPQIRVPQNSPTTYNFLDYDPDGDNVRCRYGIKNNLECSTCKTVPGFTLDENACSLSFSGSSSPGVHVFELVLEDFPRQNTTLKYNDGTSTVKYPVSLNASDPLSKIPLQFLVIVGSAVPSNVLGEYIPKYITPTVHHGTFIRTSLGKKFSFPVSAVSTKSQINDIEISGPLNIEKTFEYNNVTGVGKAMIKWTPTANDVGEDIPICFIAETTAEYQSELRCIIVVVEESQNESSIVIANEAPALGGFLSFTPKGKNSDGTIRMDSRFKLSEIYTGSCSPASSWKCHQGDCGTITTSEYGETDPGQSGDNCQLQGFVTRSLQNDKPFDLMDQGCCWIYNTEDLGSWSMIAHIDLGRRSDTGNPNRSPITTMPPQIRVPQNSPTTYNLLDYDPDGDNVRCRYGIKNNLECSTCKTVPGFTLDENACSLSFSGSSSPGVHVFELVLEDFPRQNTTLKYNDGTSTVKYPVSLNASDPLSKIPLQFLVIVGSAVPSNVLGEYIPKYITPTVHHGTFIRTSLGKEFSFPVSAVSTKSQINDIEISGPLNIEKTFEYNNVTGVGKAMIKWTPTANDVGEDIPICFIAETTTEYQSDLRCIIVVVEESQNESDVECTDTTMTLYVSKSSVNGFNETNLRLNDPSCLVTTNGSHIIASVSLNSCGTQVEETVDEVIFRNEITSFDNPYDVITREHRIEIPFTCKFSRKSRLSASFEAHKSASFSTGVGFGNFTYLFEFYDSSAFRTVIDPKTYPIKLKLKDMIYMGIKVRSSLSNIRLFVESCRATPHDNPNDPIYYDIITNGCTKDKTTKVYSGSPKEFRFGLQAFSFIGNYEQVYISCTVLLCGAGDNKTRCAQGCTDNYNRRKRSMVSDTQRHFISQGPLRLVENSSGSPGSSLNRVIVVALIVAIALVA